MIGLPSGVRVWLACGYTDMRKGMDGLAVLVQQALNEDPFNGAVFAFRGKREGLAKPNFPLFCAKALIVGDQGVGRRRRAAATRANNAGNSSPPNPRGRPPIKQSTNQQHG